MLRAHASVGAGACVVVLVAATTTNLVQGHVNPLIQPVSNLALGRAGWLVRTMFAIAGFALLALAAALRPTLRGSLRASTLLALGGLAIALLAAFPTDPSRWPSTFGGRLHAALATTGFACVCAGANWASALARMDGLWRSAARGMGLLAASSAVALLLLLLVGLGNALVDGLPLGLLERVVMGLLLAWMVAVCRHLWRLQRFAPVTPSLL